MHPRQLTILSGKGGTGKTTVGASFLFLAERAVAADCDVDAPNLHLLLEAREIEREDFYGAVLARIDSDRCTGCGECEAGCPFGAITGAEVSEMMCEGCGVCELICPEDAITMDPVVTGTTRVSETVYGPLVYALLNPGSEATGKLVTETKRKAVELAGERGLEMVLVDGSPGIGCPVIASVAGSDLILAVAEATAAGLWGLERVAGVAEHFGVPMVACTNKFDINPGVTGEIRKLCGERKIELLGEIPFDEEVNLATTSGEILTEKYEGPASTAIRELWYKVNQEMLIAVDRER
jgi:MinD superfamily P-loop ATPase